MAKKSGLLIKEKNLLVWRGEDELETTVRLSERKGLLLSLDWDENGNIEVVVRKTVNGCPGVRKPDFVKVYRT